MCDFFDKRGCPASVTLFKQTIMAHNKLIDRQSALQTSWKENNKRIPFTLTFRLHIYAVKSIILKTFKLPGTFKYAPARYKTCPFICNVEKMLGSKRSIKINDHFTCTSANVMYCITCTFCKQLYIGETGTRLGN